MRHRITRPYDGLDVRRDSITIAFAEAGGGPACVMATLALEINALSKVLDLARSAGADRTCGPAHLRNVLLEFARVDIRKANDQSPPPVYAILYGGREPAGMWLSAILRVGDFALVNGVRRRSPQLFRLRLSIGFNGEL